MSPWFDPNGRLRSPPVDAGTAGALGRRPGRPLASPPVDLPGPWRAVVADDDLRRDGIGLDLDDATGPRSTCPGTGEPTRVRRPATGRSSTAAASSCDAPAPGRRRWVTFDGIFYQADVWLDGAYLGDPEGYFFPHSFDITALIDARRRARAGRRGHVLARAGTSAAGATSPACSSTPRPSTATGTRAACGGRCRRTTPGRRIDRLRVLCRDADEHRAHLRLGARLDTDAARTVRLRTTADGVAVGETEHAAGGRHQRDRVVPRHRPADAVVAALARRPAAHRHRRRVLVDGELSDHRSRRTGSARSRCNDWIFSVNGERLFLKGANLLPTRPGPRRRHAGRGAPRRRARRRGRARRAARARPHRRPELYDAADELGVLLLQDFPLQWGYGRQIRREAVARRARRSTCSATTRRSCSGAPTTSRSPTPRRSRGPTGRLGRLRRFAAQQLPSWNRSVLDRWVKRAFEQADPTRPTVAHGGVPPHLPQLDGTDSHLWLGLAPRRDPRARRPGPAAPAHWCASSASSAPSRCRTRADDFVDAATWPDLDWDGLADHHGLEVDVLTGPPPARRAPDVRRVAAGDAALPGRAAAPAHRDAAPAQVPADGRLLLLWLADPAPMISASVLDHERPPKLAWAAVVEACRPVIVVADPLPAVARAPASALGLDVHVVNDLRQPVTGATVAVTCTWRGGRRGLGVPGRRRGRCRCSASGGSSSTAPDAPGDLLLGIAFTGRDADGATVTATRRAGARIVAP